MRNLFRFLFGAIFVVGYGKCGSHKFDEDLAVKVMLPLAGLAYSEDPRSCAPKLVPEFEILATAQGDCDALYPGTPCFGLIGMLKSQRALVFSFRGTNNVRQLLQEALGAIVKKPFLDKRYGYVHPTFFYGARNVWEQGRLQKILREQLRIDKDIKVYVTGHSLGGAIAALTGAWIATIFKGMKDNVLIYTFGQPRLGDEKFTAYFNSLDMNYYRITHNKDMVSCNPPIPTNYHHVGEEEWYALDSKNSSHETYQGDEGCMKGFRTSTDDHLNYYGIRVGDFCSLEEQEKFSKITTSLDNMDQVLRKVDDYLE